MASVTMSTVHEHVHERASEQRQPDQEAENMCPMLGKQQRTSDDQKPNQDHPGTGFHRQTRSDLILVAGMVLRRHRTLLVSKR
jgi:hypothetical protein